MKTGASGPVRLSVRVVPGASKNEVTSVNGTWKIRLTAPPVEGKANRALIEFLAKKLDISSSALELVSGASSRSKMVAVSGLSPEEINQRLAK